MVTRWLLPRIPREIVRWAKKGFLTRWNKKLRGLNWNTTECWGEHWRNLFFRDHQRCSAHFYVNPPLLSAVLLPERERERQGPSSSEVHFGATSSSIPSDFHLCEQGGLGSGHPFPSISFLASRLVRFFVPALNDSMLLSLLLSASLIGLWFHLSRFTTWFLHLCHVMEICSTDVLFLDIWA